MRIQELLPPGACETDTFHDEYQENDRMPDSNAARLKHYLSDIYSIEEQALAQLRMAPDASGDATLSQHFRDHLVETERHAELIRNRLEAVGGSPSAVKDAVMRLGGKGFLLFAKAQPDTPGKLTAHAHAYEALELAAYELLVRVAREAGDAETERIASSIREEERAMRDRLADDFDEAVDASLRKLGKGPAEALPGYLADAHALEQQAIQLMKRGEKIAGATELANLYNTYREESHEHAARIEDRLEALHDRPSVIKDAALRSAGLNWSVFFQALDDTPAKLAAFVYAIQHLKIAGYEMLERVARRADDDATARTARQVADQELDMAERVFGSFERAFAASVS